MYAIIKYYKLLKKIMHPPYYYEYQCNKCKTINFYLPFIYFENAAAKGHGDWCVAA